MLHTHLLSPFHFAHDMSKPPYNTLAGVLDFPLLRLQDKLRHNRTSSETVDNLEWDRRYPGIPYNLIEGFVISGEIPSRSSRAINVSYNRRQYLQNFSSPPPFSLNLAEAVKRQILFAWKITSIYRYDPVPEALLQDSQQRYAKFMNLIRTNSVQAPVPALDVDLFWHTHQLSSSNYMPWCKHHVGRYINHDDTVGTDDLVSGLNATKDAWQQIYNDDYLNPSAGISFQNAPRGDEPNTADKTPPPNLTPAQLTLWNYDVNRQLEHEGFDYRLRQLYSRLALKNEQLARSLSPPDLFSSGSGSMTRPRNAATSSHAAAQRLRSESDADANLVQQMQQTHQTFREGWGRLRWPLLVAARGWGDPSTPDGQYTRPPQGTLEVDFPMYAATWYDAKPLGYYDYVFGDGGGVIRGGGARVGGGMCAGKLDGGNCAVPPPPPPPPPPVQYTPSGCGGCG
jgi:hypothetical protein